MVIWRDLHDVLKMVSEGGLQVMTLVPELEGGAPAHSQSIPYRGKIYDQRGIRTIIQFDSDYVTTMSPEVLAMPELWKQHMEVLQKKLGILQEIRTRIEQSLLWLLLLLPFLICLTYALMTGKFSEEWLSLAITAPAASFIVWWVRERIVRFLCLLLLSPALWVVRRYVQWRFQQFVQR